jgi:Neocarzinostatin family
MVIAAFALIACEETISDGSTTASSTSVTTTAAGLPLLATDTGDALELSDLSLTGTGFDADSDMMVAQCLDESIGEDMASACDMSMFAPARSAADGTVEAELTVRTVIGTGKRLETDCLQTACVVGAGYIDDTTVVAVAPIDWAADAEAPPAPVLTISGLQLDESANTGSAEVQGRGFMPGSTVSLVQCPKAQGGNGVDADDCLYDYGTLATADASGELDVFVVVYPRFQRSSGELIDCVSTPDLCVVSDPWPKEAQNRMSLVAFAAATG